MARLFKTGITSEGNISSFVASAGATTLVVRQGATQSTTNLMEWQNTTPSALALVTSAGSIFSGADGGFGSTSALGTARLSVSAAASSIGLIVRGNATTPGNLQEWQNSGTTVLASVSSTGAFAVTGSITTPSTSFDLLNTTATTVNAFGAAGTLNLATSAYDVNIGNTGTLGGYTQTVNLFTGTSGTGTTQIINLGTGNFGNSSQTINIGTGTITTATRTINIGSTSGTGTTTLNGIVNHPGTTSPIHLNGSAGTTGQVLTSAGAGATPTWATPGAISWTAFQSGYYYYAQGGTQTNATPTLNTMTLVPFSLSVSTTFTKIGIYVNTGGAAGAVVRLGIYNSSNGLPGTRLLDAGTVATTTSSALALITISQTLAPGLYWLAAVPQTTTCSAQCKGAGHVPMVPFNGSPANSSARGLQVASVSGALPTPAGTLAMSSTPFEVFLQL